MAAAVWKLYTTASGVTVADDSSACVALQSRADERVKHVAGACMFDMAQGLGRQHVVIGQRVSAMSSPRKKDELGGTGKATTASLDYFPLQHTDTMILRCLARRPGAVQPLASAARVGAPIAVAQRVYRC
jgi:hypothetical protein